MKRLGTWLLLGVLLTMGACTDIERAAAEKKRRCVDACATVRVEYRLMAEMSALEMVLRTLPPDEQERALEDRWVAVAVDRLTTRALADFGPACHEQCERHWTRSQLSCAEAMAQPSEDRACALDLPGLKTNPFAPAATGKPNTRAPRR